MILSNKAAKTKFIKFQRNAKKPQHGGIKKKGHAKVAHQPY